MTDAGSPPPVVLVEDDDMLRLATVQALELAGHAVTAFADAESALARLDGGFEGVIVSDIRMPRMDGLELLARLKDIDPELSVILVTGHGDVPMAVRALHDGACDFLTKPFAIDHLAASIVKAGERRALVLDNRRLRAASAGADDDELGLTGNSPAMATLRAAIRRTAEADLDVLVEGETGTGKELVARILHRAGPRSGRSFIAVNCGALTGADAGVELFGHAADSVAQTRLSRTGLIAESNRGTLLLDEIDLLPPALQAGLLRVLEEREVLPIGADRPTMLNLRVIATTKRDLAAATAEGRFRADLFYRITALRLRVPPLRERGDDRLTLFAVFLEEARAALGLTSFTPPLAAIHQRLRLHDWPGNVRELRNYAYEVVLGTEAAHTVDASAGTLAEQVNAFEARLIVDALRRHGGRVATTMAELGLPRKTLYDKLARHGINPAAFRGG